MVDDISNGPFHSKLKYPSFSQKGNEKQSVNEEQNFSENFSLSQHIDGDSFNGSNILRNSAPKIKRRKNQKVVSILLDKFHYLKDKAEFALGIATTLVDQGRAVNEVAKAFFEPCKVIDKIFVPLRFLSWAGAPFVAVNFVSHGVDFFQTPSWGKILPVMNSIVDVGIAAEMVANAAYLLEHVGVAAAQNVSLWATPLSGAAIGLQSVAIAINGWGLAEVTNSLRKLNKAMKENTPEGYAKAVELLTKKPETTVEKVRSKFFKVLSANQETKLVSIHEKVQAGVLQQSDVEKTLKAVKHRFHFKQFTYGLAIVAAVTGIIGVAILLFAPTPIAPVGWAFIGLSATVSLSLVGINIYANKRLTSELRRINPEPLPEQKSPFYRRAFKWIRTKFIRRSDGTYRQVIETP